MATLETRSRGESTNPGGIRSRAWPVGQSDRRRDGYPYVTPCWLAHAAGGASPRTRRSHTDKSTVTGLASARQFGLVLAYQEDTQVGVPAPGETIAGNGSRA